jgi:hypothetical protein
LKRIVRMQRISNKKEVKRENFRYKLYNKRAENRILNCKQGISICKKRIAALNKISK